MTAAVAAEGFTIAGVEIPREAVTAVGTWILAAGTIAVVLLQLRLMLRTLSAEVFARLNDRWDTVQMRRRRRRLATSLQETRLEEIDSHIVEDVLNFFEDVGLNRIAPRARCAMVARPGHEVQPALKALKRCLAERGVLPR